MTKSILITGGCGFIGTSLISKLLEIKPEMTIRVLDNFTTGSPDDIYQVANYQLSNPQECSNIPGVSVVQGDIRDGETAIQCSHNVDCIVHLAANTGVGPSVKEPKLDMMCNVVGTFNMLEAARLNDVKKFIFASSGAPAGEVEPPIHEELPPHPVSPYGASKLAGEGYCSAYFRTFGINTVCLRFGNVYGPGSKKKSSVVAKFIRQALNGETCKIYGEGTQTRDFIYIDDLVRAVLLCIEKDIGGEIFQIATGREHTVNELARFVKKELSQRGVNMTIHYDQPMPGDVKRNFSDTSKAKRMLGWETKTDLEAGIKKTVNYFISGSSNIKNY